MVSVWVRLRMWRRKKLFVIIAALSVVLIFIYLNNPDGFFEFHRDSIRQSNLRNRSLISASVPSTVLESNAHTDHMTNREHYVQPYVADVDAPSVAPEESISVALVLLAHDREEYFRECLKSVLASAREYYRVYKTSPPKIIVSMDEPLNFGKLENVLNEEVLKIENNNFVSVSVLKHEDIHKMTVAMAKIDRHYSDVCDSVFLGNKHTNDIFTHAFVLETDTIVSLDFMQFVAEGASYLKPFHNFDAIANRKDTDPVLDSSQSPTFCVSGWHDAGFNNFQWDESKLIRTNYFPGLGWMIHRNTWTSILKPIWPSTEHYDNWLRFKSPTKDLECIAPQVSRIHHIATHGSYSLASEVWVFEKMLLASGKTTVPKEEWGLVSDFVSFESRLRTEAIQTVLDQIEGNAKQSFIVKDQSRGVPQSVSSDKNYIILTNEAKVNALLGQMGIPLYMIKSGHKGLLSVLVPYPRPHRVSILLDKFANYWGLDKYNQ